MYKQVNDMLGGIVKVTPSSKMVGDLAIFMVQNNLTPENIVRPRARISAFPDSVVSYFKGMMGQPAWGFPEELQKVVLKGEKPITCRPGELLEPVDFDKAWKEVAAFCPKTDHEAGHLPTASIPRWSRNSAEHAQGVRLSSCAWAAMCSSTAWLWERPTRSISRTARRWSSSTSVWANWTMRATACVEFELNGMRREVSVPDPSAAASVKQVTLADPEDKSQVGASIPGLVSKINVKVGDTVEENQVMAVIEAMKMETSVTARMAGKVKSILVSEGSTVKAGELLITVE